MSRQIPGAPTNEHHQRKRAPGPRPPPAHRRQGGPPAGQPHSPRDHAGKGNWSKDADIPLWAWPTAAALAAFFLFGPQVLGWLLRFVV